MQIRTEKQRERFIEHFLDMYREHGSLQAISRATGVSFRQIRRLYLDAVERGLMYPLNVGRKSRDQMKHPAPPRVGGRVPPLRTPSPALPADGCVARYIFTCAQNNTRIHEEVWRNMRALAKYYHAQIFVARFTYVKHGLGALGDKAVWTTRKETVGEDEQELWWDARLTDYLWDSRLEVAPGLVWCGEMNILPTANRPLSGLSAYTGRKSAIIPHVKLEMESVVSSKHEPTKFNYTTGTVTMRNYIQRKAGLKAEFDHVYGGLLVEVDAEGDWFVRQLNADRAGTIHDLDLKVSDGEVTTENPVESIRWGDIHVEDLDMTAANLAWGCGGMLDTLHPKCQILDDVLGFRCRTHHEIDNPHIQFMKHINKQENVREEVECVARFLKAVQRDWCKTVVVESNHHEHLGRWLRERDARKDPVNAEFWFDLQRRVYERLRKGEPLIYFKEALEAVGFDTSTVYLLEADESFIVAGIENGMHGHLGPIGSRGTHRNLARMGRKINLGHGHCAGIIGGAFATSVMSKLDPDWTRGPSSWSHSSIVTYSNGKRAIVTFWGKKWRAYGECGVAKRPGTC